MTIYKLLYELQLRNVRLKTENGNLKLMPSSSVSEELREGIRKYKPLLLTMFAPCYICGANLVVNVFQTWFVVKCPIFPCHFLEERHEVNYGHSFRGQRLTRRVLAG